MQKRWSTKLTSCLLKVTYLSIIIIIIIIVIIIVINAQLTNVLFVM
jgi:hypothetical protein